jgi:hypothetical protein
MFSLGVENEAPLTVHKPGDGGLPRRVWSGLRLALAPTEASAGTAAPAPRSAGPVRAR